MMIPISSPGDLAIAEADPGPSAEQVLWRYYVKKCSDVFGLEFNNDSLVQGVMATNRDLSTKSLRLYLSSRQAVADIAKFRTKIARTRRLTKNKWVVFGGGYGGSLAVWSRIKHPDLFAAAVGSSAPIQGKVNFYEYFEVIYKTLATHNRECPGAVKRAYGLIMYMLLLPHYHSKLKFDYKLCEPLTINSEMEQFFILENLMLITAAIVQSNKKNNTIMGKPGEISIDEFCEKMTDTSLGLPYDRYASIVNTMLRNKRFHCFPASYKNYVKEYSKSSSKNIVYRRGRQWLYQCCTEFGYFFTTDFKNHSFSGLPLRYYVKKCSDVFGLEFNNDSLVQSVMATNRYYGGFNVSGSKIIFSNGSNDPWYPMGITKDISKDLPAVFIKGEAHCGDMLQPQDTDSAELIQAREKIFQILQKWLKK
ncbi:putative serine protease K12H4.7 [Dugong dugon]